jgi:hypothetical protein
MDSIVFDVQATLLQGLMPVSFSTLQTRAQAIGHEVISTLRVCPACQ